LTASHHHGKIPVQFINNTPASTKEKAARKAERRRAEEEERERRMREVARDREERERKGSGASEQGGQRMLLPKP
jgi:primosomal protein N''